MREPTFYDTNFLLGPLTLVVALVLFALIIYGMVTSKPNEERGSKFFKKFGVYPYGLQEEVRQKIRRKFLGEKFKIASVYSRRQEILSRSVSLDSDEESLEKLNEEEKKYLGELKDLIALAVGFRKDLTLDLIEEMRIYELYPEEIKTQIKTIREIAFN